MPIRANDPRYLAEYIPTELQRFIDEARRRFGLPATHVGAKGDLNHASGYHRSRNWIVNSPDSRFRLDDYSVRSAADRAGDPNWLSAVDISLPPDRLVEVCQRLRMAAIQRDPRLHGWREFLGTLNGTTVYGFDFIGGYTKTPDRSHLWHLHLSRQRQHANTPMLDILDVMLGDDMTPEQDQRLRNIEAWAFGTARGQVTPDAGTPHVSKYVPNEWLKTLVDRPPVTPAPVDLDALVERLTPVVEAAAERAVRKVLGAVDGATPAG